jgi:GDP-L-fucose synthase
VDDLADAALFLMLHYDAEEIVNVGVGKDINIAELAELIREVVEYQGDIVYDHAKPDGTPRKLLDVSRLHALGWKAKIPWREGVAATYRSYVERISRSTVPNGSRW